jgi:formylglycine-generating enzyme required for sulfatase activity
VLQDGPISRRFARLAKDERGANGRSFADQPDVSPMIGAPEPDRLDMPIDLAREEDFLLGAMRLRPSRCELTFGGEVIALEPRIMQVLVALAGRRGQVVSRDALVARCWGGRSVSDDAIHRCIAKIRKLAERDTAASFTIETVPRVGYRLNVYDEAIAAAAPPGGGETARTPRMLWPSVALAAAAAAAAAVFAFSPRTEPLPARSQAHPVVVLGADAAKLPQGAVFRDCADRCPEMVVIHAGYYFMGSSDAARNAEARDAPAFQDDQGPVHEVFVAHRFALSRFDVTREEYARYAAESGRSDAGGCNTLTATGTFAENLGANWRHPGIDQTARDPVVCISWSDASAYAGWLARGTGKHYRLPSEAEWEYAARAQTQYRPASPASLCTELNGADIDYHAAYPKDGVADVDCKDGFATTSPVGTFGANPFGLSDMLGNAAQWTADCYHRSYDGAPTDGSAWISGDCGLRVARGGYWALDPRDITPMLRAGSEPEQRFNTNTIRLARDL